MSERIETPSRTAPAVTLFKLTPEELTEAIVAWVTESGETIPVGAVTVEATPNGANLQVVHR